MAEGATADRGLGGAAGGPGGEARLATFDGQTGCCAQMVGIVAEFSERGSSHLLTEQAVRELITAARREEWAERQAYTLVLLIFHSAMTARAAATLEEAVPGLARYVAQQRASGQRLEARSDVARK